MNRKHLFFIISIFLCACSTPQQQETIDTILMPDSSDYIELFPVGLDSSHYIIRDFYAGHGIVISGHSYMLFDDSVPQYYRFPFEDSFTDIAWLDGNCFLAKDSSILYVEDNGKKHTILLTDHLIKRIFPSKEGIYFIGDSIISIFRFNTSEAEPIIQLKGSINDVLPLEGNKCFVAINNYILLLEKGDVYKVHIDSLEINSIDISSECLFYSTNKHCCLLNTQGYYVPIVEKGARQLKILDDNLFIIFNDNSCGIIINVSNYNQFIQNIHQEQL